ncbi:MAG TPA: hypothetical protein VFC24_04900 [Casimicrobiaceae bacterium]|nr:hypothetical protein [Casimicrobiaceae bacterium]
MIAMFGVVALLLGGCEDMFRRDAHEKRVQACDSPYAHGNTCEIHVTTTNADPPEVHLGAVSNVRIVWVPTMNGFEFRAGSVKVKPNVSDDGETVENCPGPNDNSCNANGGPRHHWVWKNTANHKPYRYEINLYRVGDPPGAAPAIHIDPTVVNQ